jgi:hypothetical protein
MDKIRNSSYAGIAISQTDTSKVENAKEQISNSTVKENIQSSDKSSCEEARTRDKETGLQASLRKQMLLTQADTKTGATSVAKTERVPFSYKSETELRDLVSKKAFPAVKDAMEKNNLTLNGPNCNTATGMMKNALEKMGVAGVTIKDTHGHAYLEVETNDGKKIFIDPTISQFFKDGSAIDSKLHHKGFIGTKEELKQLIRDNIDQWIPTDTGPVPDEKAVDAYKGKNVPGITRQEAEKILSIHFEMAERRYFGDVTTHIGDAARKQAEWYSKGNLDEPLDLPNGIWGHGNSAPRLKRLYQAMEENLRQLQEK